jgi:hypothetical protein
MYLETVYSKLECTLIACSQMFYDADILEEKVLLEWAGKVSKKYVSRELSQEIHAKAEPFIKWLKEAEEEDDSDSEEEEEDDDLEVCHMTHDCMHHAVMAMAVFYLSFPDS